MHPEFWCQQTLRISVAGPDGSTSLVVDKPFALVGTDARSDIILPDQCVPARKLYLHATPDGVFCVDLAPGRPDKQKTHGWLEPDRPVHLGPYALRVTWGDGEPVPGGKSRRKLDAQGTLPEPRPKLIARAHGQEIGRGAVTRQLSVLGRSKPSSMIIKSHVISGCHCALVWVADECWVVDLLSANGTYLNGRPLTAAKLHPGDILILGKVEVSYLPPEPAASSQAAASPEEDTKSGIGVFEDLDVGDEAEEAAEKDMCERSDLLQEQPAELSRQVATWEAARRQEELRLAEEAQRLEAEAARIASETAGLESQRAAFAAEAAELREQIAVQQRQLDTDRAHFAERQEAAEHETAERSDLLREQQAELSGQMATWEAARQQEELRSAGQAKRLDTEAARIAAEAAGLETQRTGFVAEVAAWREQTALQQRQLDADRAHFAGRQEAAEKEISERSNSLHAQQTEFNRQAATWEAARQQEEVRLAEGAKRLAAEAARIAAEAAGLETQRASVAAEAAASREQTAGQQRQLDTDRAHFAGRQEAVEKGLRERSDALQAQQAEFSRQVATWEAARQQEELRLAEVSQPLASEVARIAAEAAGLETQRAAFAAEAATFHEQIALQQRQLDADRARLAGQQEAVEKEWSERLAALRTQQADSSRQLAKEQADFSRQVTTWEAQCRREDSRLTEEAKRLEAEAAKIAAEAAGLETRRTTFHVEMNAGANALRVQQEQLSRQAADWESTRQLEASRLAEQARQLEAEGAEVAARAAALAAERAEMRQELAREAGLAPRQADGEDQDETPPRSQGGREQSPDDDDPLAVLRRTWQQGADKERHAAFRVRLILFAAATACLAVLAAVVWWNYAF